MQETYTKDKANEISDAIEKGEEKAKGAVHDAQQRLKQGQDQVEHLVKQADHQLHENPWPIVAGVAVGCLFLGFFAGNVRSR